MIRGAQEEKDYSVLDKLFPFLAAFIDQSTECEKTAPMTTLHTLYRELSVDVTKDMR